MPSELGSNSRVFFDSNILIYAIDEGSGEKCIAAREAISEASQNARVIISTQVMQEFYNIATRKLGMDPFYAKSLTKGLERFEVVTNDANTISEAIDISILNKLSFWDSLLIAAASQVNCDIFYSEDMNAGQTIAGVKVINPFDE